MADDERDEQGGQGSRIPIRDRRKLRLDEPDGGAVVGEPAPPEAEASGGEPDSGEELAQARAQAESHLDDLKRLKAEFDNYRKRTLREQSRLVEMASAEIVAQLLGVLDHFSMAVSSAAGSRDFDSMFKGVEMVYGELRSVLQGAGLEILEPRGEPFDPNLHEAVQQSDGDGSGQMVVEDVLRSGYAFKGSVLRPAMVKVTQDAAAAEHLQEEADA